jgi:arginine exporter protein ArgO
MEMWKINFLIFYKVISMYVNVHGSESRNSNKKKTSKKNRMEYLLAVSVLQPSALQTKNIKQGMLPLTLVVK